MLLLSAASAHASEFLIFPRNSDDAVAAKAEAAVPGTGWLAGIAGAFVDYDTLVLDQAAPKVQAQFAAKKVDAKVEVQEVTVTAPLTCSVGAGTPVKVQQFQLEPGSYSVLHVTTAGVVAWLGDVSGVTKKSTFEGFQAEGLDVAVCPLGR